MSDSSDAGVSRGIEFPDREAGLHWFDHAAWIARCRVRSPDRYTAHAADYLDVLCWAFERRYRNVERHGTFEAAETDESDGEDTTQAELVTDGGRERPEGGIYRWIECPECGSGDVSLFYNNGRLRLSCDDCHQASSKLVGRHTFR